MMLRLREQWRRYPGNNDGQAVQNKENVRLSAWLELATWNVCVAALRNTTTCMSSWSANCCRTAV